VLFIALWTVKDRLPRSGMLTALFGILYGIFRIAAEFFREPEVDNIFGVITMGQFLSIFMIVAGIWLFRYRRNSAPARGAA
jgi:phosphatidylglycerol:prolipoprotein diacylglycerol transferase